MQFNASALNTTAINTAVVAAVVLSTAGISASSTLSASVIGGNNVLLTAITANTSSTFAILPPDKALSSSIQSNSLVSATSTVLVKLTGNMQSNTSTTVAMAIAINNTITPYLSVSAYTSIALPYEDFLGSSSTVSEFKVLSTPTEGRVAIVPTVQRFAIVPSINRSMTA